MGLPTAFVAGLILAREWERVEIVLKGMNGEDRIQVLLEALESVGSYRAACALNAAIKSIDDLTSREE